MRDSNDVCVQRTDILDIREDGIERGSHEANFPEEHFQRLKARVEFVERSSFQSISAICEDPHCMQ